MSFRFPEASLDEALPDLTPLCDLLHNRRVVALTGAGCSTESGIPDYRGPTTKHLPRRPIQHREFLEKPDLRTRYWARSAVAWTRFSHARPNATHHALAQLEQLGTLRGILTQNVDRLHHAAGSRRVIELHGALAEVRCLDCDGREDRQHLQRRLVELNEHWNLLHTVEAPEAPDGDADLTAEQVRSFRVASCLRCGGVLKPDVVFFGDNVPKETLARAWSLFDEAEVLLVVGSSLTVFSGYRFPLEASKRSMPVAIVTLGETRADPLAQVRVDARTGAVLPALVHKLKERTRHPKQDTQPSHGSES